MSSTSVGWYQDPDSLVGELRRGGFGPAEIPRIAGFDDIREIRRGGQGIVYSAIQRSTKRRVAVKVLLEGAFASVSGRRRFEREIDLVAGLRHPNIVSVHDSGVTGDGRLYFVMEYIDGVPLDQYIANRQSSLSTKDRTTGLLILFAKVCDAVNYAHQRGVIHRDLKPGNILVDSAGEPHVCDFGLAKTTTDSALNDSRIQSMSVTGQFLGSLPWASPEQLEGSHTRVDVRTDVYSLGVILYQMLCGRLPFETSGGIRQLFENIAKSQPPRPSAIAKNLDDEIDTIVMKCLDKDALRRYQSTAELVGDIRHYLAGEPIQAKRDSAWYTLRKTLRRYQLAAGLTLVVLVALTIALTVSVYSWRQARHESAQREAIGDFLKKMLTSVDPGNDGANVRFLDVINKAAREIGPTVKDQPLVEAGIRGILGSTYFALGMYEQAENQLQKSHEFCAMTLGPTNRNTLEVLAELPTIAAARGRMEEAEQQGRAALETIQSALGTDDSLTLRMMEKLGDILNQRGKRDEAEKVLRSTLDIQRRKLGPDHRETLGTMNTLAVLLKQLGRIKEAEDLYRHVVTEGIRRDGLKDPGVLTAMNNLALALQSQGKLDESESMQRQTLDTRLEVLGEEHPDTLVNMSNLATLLIERRKLDEAQTLLKRVVEVESRTLGPENPTTLTALNNMAKVVQDLGRIDEAETLFRRTYEARRKSFGPDHATTLIAQANLAALVCARGRTAEGVDILKTVLAARQRTLGENHVDTMVTRNNLGMALQKQGKLDEAATYYEAACRSAVAALSPDNYVAGLFQGNYGRCLMALGRWPEAEKELESSCKCLEAVFGAADPRTQQNIRSLIEVFQQTGQPDNAAHWGAKLPTTQPEPSSPATHPHD